jgi:UDP-glucose:(heptosyl)LPS alpha-1,3-glucosyltransferase
MKLNSGFGFRLFGRRARRWCRENRPEVAHSMTVAFAADIYHPHAGVYAEMQSQAVASRATVTSAKFKQLMLHLSGKQRTLLTLERRAVEPGSFLAGGPKRVISLCAMMTRQLKAHYAVDASRVVELPNPRMTALSDIDPKVVRESRAWFRGHYRLGERDKVAVFVGHDFRRKGLRYAIEAVARTKDWKLLVVGLGKARESVELADLLGVGDANPKAGESGDGPRVLFVGPTKEMHKVYAASDALILPTFYDSFGLVVLEALSHGLPVVSTEFLGANYLVKEHDAGVIVASPKHVSEMAAA